MLSTQRAKGIKYKLGGKTSLSREIYTAILLRNEELTCSSTCDFSLFSNQDYVMLKSEMRDFSFKRSVSETNKTGEGTFAFNSCFRLLLSNIIFDTALSDFEIGYQLYLFDRKAKQVQFIVRYNSFFIKL